MYCVRRRERFTCLLPNVRACTQKRRILMARVYNEDVYSSSGYGLTVGGEKRLRWIGARFRFAESVATYIYIYIHLLRKS